jgi:hypothetical protein
MKFAARFSALFFLTALLMFGQAVQPQWIMFAGGGYDHYATPATVGTPATFGTRTSLIGGVASRVSENVYSWNTILAKSDGAKMLTGVAAQVFNQDDMVKLWAIGQVGGESTSGSVDIASAVSGAIQINIGRWFKAPAIDLLGVVAINKSASPDAPTAVKPAIGIGLSWHSK